MSTWRESSFFPYNTDSKPETETESELTMSTANISKSAAEVKLNPPKVFSGKRTELNKFLQDVLIYLMVNKEVYNNDEKKDRISSVFYDRRRRSILERRVFSPQN